MKRVKKKKKWFRLVDHEFSSFHSRRFLGGVLPPDSGLFPFNFCLEVK
jgi:hypothetical protein